MTRFIFSSTAILIFLSGSILRAQDLTISNTGETGTSGTNWSISNNILSVPSGTANVHPSVIGNYLANFGNLIIDVATYGAGARSIIIDGIINYSGNSNRTLIFKAPNNITMSANSSVISTNAQLNLVLRSAAATASPLHGNITLSSSTIQTNGGHLWIAGGSTDVTWNGLTVGEHYARTYTSNLKGIEITGCTINTSGGNLYMAGMSHQTSVTTGTNFGVYVIGTSINTDAGSIEI